MKTFIVADDHPLFRQAISQVLASQFDNINIIEADDIVSLQKVMAEQQQVDLILLDLHMPGAYGFGALAFIKGIRPDANIVVVSANERVEVMQKAIQYGAKGFLPKSANIDIMRNAFNSVLAGEKWLPEQARDNTLTPNAEEKSLIDGIASLTQQQYVVLTMLAQGLLNKQIAYELDVTEATIKAHMTAIFRKLNVRSRTQVALAISKLDLDPTTDIA